MSLLGKLTPKPQPRKSKEELAYQNKEKVMKGEWLDVKAANERIVELEEEIANLKEQLDANNDE